MERRNWSSSSKVDCLGATALAAPLYNKPKKQQRKKNLVLWKLRLAAVPEIKHCIDTKVWIKSVTRCLSVEALVATSVSSLVINYLLLTCHIHQFTLNTWVATTFISKDLEWLWKQFLLYVNFTSVYTKLHRNATVWLTKKDRLRLKYLS